MNNRYSVIGAVILTLVLMVTCLTDVLAQRYVDINCGYGTIRRALTADSLNRVANPNTIYRLHRGTPDSVYYLDAILTDWGSMPLNFVSTGTGTLPTIIAATLSDGTPFSPIFGVKEDFSMKGVTITALNTLGSLVLRVFSIKADSVTLRLDSCQIIKANQSSIRVENQKAKIFLTNTRISNVAQDWSNARVVDNRGVTIDTLSMVNCSFYRIGSRVYREGGGILSYGYFDHNTVVDVGTSTFQMGNTVNLTFTNNLMVNCGFIGHGISGNGAVVDVNPIPSGQYAYIANNMRYTDTTKLNAAYRVYSDTITSYRWFSDTLGVFIANAGTSNQEIGNMFPFKKAPADLPFAAPLDSIVKLYWQPASPISGDASIIRIDSTRLLNLGYSSTAPAFTFGSDGKPVGSLEWFTVLGSYAVPNGWNMVSVPHDMPDFRKEVLFPTAISNAFEYAGTYLRRDVLTTGTGYWLKVSGAQNLSLNGRVRIQDSISVVPGWNMIGSISYPVPVATITSNPGGMSVSQFFGYSRVYLTADTIQPGRGYWVKVNQPGKLFLASGVPFVAANRVRIVPGGELPPSPPTENSAGPNTGTPKQFVLEQNYPNPFNPSTVIRYSLPTGGMVSLVVYNMLGQQMATLVNGIQKAGSYTIHWDGSTDGGAKLSSGLYFYQLRTDAFESTRKMMLVH